MKVEEERGNLSTGGYRQNTLRAEREIERDRQTDRQRDRETDRQRDRQTERERERERERESNKERRVFIFMSYYFSY